MTPDFENYSLQELHEALNGLDVDKYPERKKLIIDLIEQRKNAGFVLSGESADTAIREAGLSFYEVALPIWWRYTWRSTLSIFVFSILVFIVVSVFLGFVGLGKYAQLIVLVLQLAALPFIGIFFMRQALVSRYRWFYIELSQKTGNG